MRNPVFIIHRDPSVGWWVVSTEDLKKLIGYTMLLNLSPRGLANERIKGSSEVVKPSDRLMLERTAALLDLICAASAMGLRPSLASEIHFSIQMSEIFIARSINLIFRYFLHSDLSSLLGICSKRRSHFDKNDPFRQTEPEGVHYLLIKYW